jgi:ribosomal protein S6--L-glutamate ligase
VSDEVIIWITNPENYDPGMRAENKQIGAQRMDLFAAAGLPVRVVHASNLVAGWAQRPRLWCQDEDLLERPRGFMLSAWPWDAATGQHFRAISRTIRASDSVLLNDGIRDPDSLGADKLAMSNHAAALGVPVLPAVAVPFGRYTRRVLPIVERVLDGDTYIVKPREMATGFGVLKAQGQSQLRACLDLLTPSGLGCFIQPYFANSGDLRVYVHRDQVLAGMLRRPAPDDYLANLSVGGSADAALVPPDIAGQSLKLADSLDADYLCVDWLVNEERGHVFNEWMTIAAAFEDLPEPQRTTVASALTRSIANRLAAAGVTPSRP